MECPAHESAEITEAAVTAWKSHEQTGLHLTWSETREWMITWGKESELAAPECHK
jgi:predicted transcriptional regulator